MDALAIGSIVVVGGVFFLAAGVFVISIIAFWMRARLSGVPLGVIRIATMFMRKTNPATIITCRIALKRAGLDAPPDAIERYLLAGRDPRLLAQALIAARNRGAMLSFEDAAAAELSGRDSPRWFGEH